MHRKVYVHTCVLLSHTFDYLLVSGLMVIPVKSGLKLEDNVGNLLIHVAIEMIGSRAGCRGHMASARGIYSLELSIELKYVSSGCTNIRHQMRGGIVLSARSHVPDAASRHVVHLNLQHLRRVVRLHDWYACDSS